MTSPRLDPVIHPPHRLRICAFLTPLEEAEFQILRDELQVSDSVLSKQLTYLTEADYVRLRKGAHRGRQRTWARLTGKGRRAFAAHVAALEELVGVRQG